MNPGVQVKPSVASIAGKALVESMAYSLAGIGSAYRYPQISVGYNCSRRDAAPLETIKPQSLTIPETQAFLSVVGIDERTLKNEITGKLQEMVDSKTASTFDIARSLAGQLVVGQFVERLYI